MPNQFSEHLGEWLPQRNGLDWVLGTVYAIEGPSYRKPGAMMFFNSQGQQLGMLSGGCLESDIHNHARRLMSSGAASTLCYDGNDEDDISFQLGIGCGGRIHILLQSVQAANNYLGLEQVQGCLQRREALLYLQHIPTEKQAASARTIEPDDSVYPQLLQQLQGRRAGLVQQDDADWLCTQLRPPPHLLVIGGGVDARPLVGLATQLGWDVSLCDPRPANARREHFMNATRVLRCAPADLHQQAALADVDAAVVMTHNVSLDAAAMTALQQMSPAYIGLLGPATRRAEVLAMAGLAEADLKLPLAGPAGLRLGAELPEEIALSVLAECHAVLQGADAASMSGLIAL